MKEVPVVVIDDDDDDNVENEKNPSDLNEDTNLEQFQANSLVPQFDSTQSTLPEVSQILPKQRTTTEVVPKTLPDQDVNSDGLKEVPVPGTPRRKRRFDITDNSPKETNEEYGQEPRTPSAHRSKRVRGVRTPQSARVVSADAYFPSIVRRTPTHRTTKTLNPYYSAPAGHLSTPSTPTVYSLAKALFQRGSNSTQVVGRSQERAALEKFLNRQLETKGKGALYLSGLPGTGKSALLNEVLEKRMAHYSGQFPIKVASINCMTVENASDIFTMIHQEITQDEDETDFIKREIKEEEEEVEKMISGDGERLTLDRGKRMIIEDLERRILGQPSSSQTRHVIVLDELDHIMTKDQEVLFRIFQWAFAANSTLILFGIANALDLTDRFLPRLRSNSLTPQLLAFKPYTAPEIACIIEERLWSLLGGRKEGDTKSAPPLMHPTAIQLCARKTASNTGDLRKAFDLCRRSIETVEEEVRRQNTRDSSNADTEGLPQGRGSPGLAWKRALVNGSNSKTLTVLTLETAPRATISHVAKVCSTAFGGTMAQRIKVLNVQQKAVLCVLVVGERQSTTKLTVMRLFDRYTQICGRDKVLTQLTFADFLDVVSALESNGVVSITGVCGRKGLGSAVGRMRTSKGGGGASASRSANGVRDDYSQRRITANVHQLDLMSAVGATPLLRSFLIET